MNDQEQQLEELANKASSTAGHYAKKAGGKLLKKGAKAAGKLAGKGAAALGKSLLAFFCGPVGLVVIGVILAVILLLSFGSFIDFDSRSTNGNIQSEDPSEFNESGFGGIQEDGTSDFTITELSEYNLLVNAFYMNYANQSYFKRYDGNQVRAGETLTSNGVLGRDEKGNPIPVEVEVIDKFRNESGFMISYELLWQLDEYLHNRKFKYPEAFIRPVYHDEETMEVKELVDEEGKLVVESAAYVDGKRDESQTVNEMWDHGFASVLRYAEYEEDAKYEFELLEKQVLVGEGNDAHVELKNIEATDIEEHYMETEYVDNTIYPRTVFLIDKAATFAGTITPTIDYQWRRQNAVVEYITTVYETVTVERSKEVPVNNPIVDPEKGTLYGMYVQGRYQGEIYENCRMMVSANGLTIVNDKCSESVILKTPFEVEFIEKTKPDKEVITWTETIKLKTKHAKYRWDITPLYTGTPSFDQFQGGQYFRDYLMHYKARVPNDVMDELSLRNRVGKDPEKLKEIVELYNLNKKGISNSTETKKPGEYSQSAYQNAYRYLDIFNEIGPIYGVDPELLLAMAAQESSGNHESKLPGYVNSEGEKYTGAAVGLMQIQNPGSTVDRVKAYNHVMNDGAGGWEEYRVCGRTEKNSEDCLDAKDLRENIIIGAMQLASRYTAFDGHHMLSLQSYNFGVTGMETVVRLCGDEPKNASKSQENLSFMTCRQTLHDNPHLVNFTSETYGDPVYIENVLKYYPEGKELTFTQPDGTVTHFDTSLINIENYDGTNVGFFGTLLATIQSVGNFLKTQWDRVVDQFDTFFDDKNDTFEMPVDNNFFYKSTLTAFDQEIMEKMVFAMANHVTIDEVGTITDDTWKEQYEIIFSQTSSLTWGLDGYAGNRYPTQYFENLVRSPLPESLNVSIIHPFGNKIDGVMNYGIGVYAAPGTNIYSIYEGTVKDVKNIRGTKGYTVIIEHANGMVSEYSRLDEKTVKVKKGDKVKQGTLLGSVGASSDSKSQIFLFSLSQNGTAVDPGFVFYASNTDSNYIPVRFEGEFLRPLQNGKTTCFQNCFIESRGKYYNDIYPWIHEGVDMVGLYESKPPIYAIGDGRVTLSTTQAGTGFGNHVVIEHEVLKEDGTTEIYSSHYAHMDSQSHLRVGDIVKAGDLIGYMGQSGLAGGGIHLHFALHKGSYVAYNVNYIEKGAYIESFGPDYTTWTTPYIN